MILSIFKKYSDKNSRIDIIITIIKSLNITDGQKQLYLDSIDFLDDAGIEKLYRSLQNYVGEIESKQIEDISKNNFTKIAGMRKKEAMEKQKEINSFGFLLNNL